MTLNPYESPNYVADAEKPRSWIKIGLAGFSGLITFLHVLGAIGWFLWFLVGGGHWVEGVVYGSLSIVGSIGFLTLSIGIARRHAFLIRCGLVIIGVQVTVFLTLISLGPEIVDKLFTSFLALPLPPL